jgi:hypothetical protein
MVHCNIPVQEITSRRRKFLAGLASPARRAFSSMGEFTVIDRSQKKILCDAQK